MQNQDVLYVYISYETSAVSTATVMVDRRRSGAFENINSYILNSAARANIISGEVPIAIIPIPLYVYVYPY